MSCNHFEMEQACRQKYDAHRHDWDDVSDPDPDHRVQIRRRHDCSGDIGREESRQDGADNDTNVAGAFHEDHAADCFCRRRQSLPELSHRHRPLRELHMVLRSPFDDERPDEEVPKQERDQGRQEGEIDELIAQCLQAKRKQENQEGIYDKQWNEDVGIFQFASPSTEHRPRRIQPGSMSIIRAFRLAVSSVKSSAATV